MSPYINRVPRKHVKEDERRTTTVPGQINRLPQEKLNIILGILKNDHRNCENLFLRNLNN